MLKFFMGVKASLTLGREEKPWVKGLVGLNNVVECLFSWREGGEISWSMFHGIMLFVINLFIVDFCMELWQCECVVCSCKFLGFLS